MKKDKRMTAKKLRLQNFLICFAFTAVAILAVTFFFIGCRVKRIAVSPTLYADKSEILKAASVTEGEHLYAISKGKIERAVRSCHPYIKSVTVKRSFPGTVKIEVKEYALSYLYRYGDSVYLLADDLTVVDRLPADAVPPYKLTELTLPKIKEPKKKGDEKPVLELSLFKKPVFDERENLQWVENRLSEIGDFPFHHEISELHLEEPYNIRFRIADKYTVLLGNERDLKDKLFRVYDTLLYLDKNIHGVAGTLHATENGPVSFEITGVSGKK